MDKREQAYTLYKKGLKYTEIARRLSLPTNTVKSWEKRYWKKQDAPKTAPTLHPKPAPIAPKDYAQSKPQGGAPLGNVNAVGNSGGQAPPGNQNALKHGGYSKLLFATFAGDKMQAIEDAGSVDEETAMVEEIHLLTLRESYLLERIHAYMEPPPDESGKKKPPLSVSGIVSSSDTRDFARLDKDAGKSREDRTAYMEAIDRKTGAGERLPGTPKHVTTTTEANYLIVERLEKLLSDVQKQKAHNLDQLAELRARHWEMAEGQRIEENNLMEMIRAYTAEELNTDDIPELEQTSTAGDDVVESTTV